MSLKITTGPSISTCSSPIDVLVHSTGPAVTPPKDFVPDVVCGAVRKRCIDWTLFIGVTAAICFRVVRSGTASSKARFSISLEPEARGVRLVATQLFLRATTQLCDSHPAAIDTYASTSSRKPPDLLKSEHMRPTNCRLTWRELMCLGGRERNQPGVFRYETGHKNMTSYVVALSRTNS